MIRVTWIGGWGVNPESMRPATASFLPEASHALLPPGQGAAQAAASSDWVVAWSLGAWCVLSAAANGLRFPGRVLLLAPFVAFCSEFGLGGRCSLSQVRWLGRWMERAPLKALGDFYQRAGLTQPLEQLPYSSQELLKGLEWLAADASPQLRHFAAQGLPPNWSACLGEVDPLLDAQGVRQALGGCLLLPGVGHDFESLMRAYSAQPALCAGPAQQHRRG